MTTVESLLASWREKANNATESCDRLEAAYGYRSDIMWPDLAKIIAESRTMVPALLDAVEAILALHHPEQASWSSFPQHKVCSCGGGTTRRRHREGARTCRAPERLGFA